MVERRSVKVRIVVPDTSPAIVVCQYKNQMRRCIRCRRCNGCGRDAFRRHGARQSKQDRCAEIEPHSGNSKVLEQRCSGEKSHEALTLPKPRAVDFFTKFQILQC